MIVILALLIVYWAYNIYQTSRQEITVKSPDITVPTPKVNINQPDIVIPQQQVVVNVSEPFDPNRPYKKSDVSKRISDYCEPRSGLGC